MSVEISVTNPILEVLCHEPEGDIVRNVYPMQLSLEKIRYLWEKLKDFDVLFNDFIRGDFDAFLSNLIVQTGPNDFQPTGLMWEVDDVGLFSLTNIRPAESGEAHFVFWDKRFKGREQLCREMCKYVMDKYGLNRLEVRIGLYAFFSLNAMERIGFKHEGRLRQSVLWKGEWFDVNVYSVLKDELDSFMLGNGGEKK